MKILCAPDKFKESLSAPDAAAAMARGIRRVLPDAQVDLCPIADGGEGTVEALVAATGGTLRTTTVAGPLGRPVEATWGLLGRRDDQPLTAVIEMASASGLALIPEDQRNPAITSTYGTGQLIAAALDAGAKRLLIGIGGSATHDGGFGAMQALGGVFLDDQDKPITEPLAGGLLERIARLDLSAVRHRLRDARITVACDVTNPLTGLNGAAMVYAAQKGATVTDLPGLDAALSHAASLWRDQLGEDVALLPGSGAAGGLGGGLKAMTGAALEPGAKLVLQAVGFSRRARGVDLCLTGEGRLDGQSLSGKACLSVAQAAGEAGVPHTIALVGSVGQDAHRTLQAGLTSYHVIGEGLSRDESIRRAGELLEATTARVVRDWENAT